MELSIDDIVLVNTCFACPEQYDALLNGEVVGYLRLRWGEFTVDCPNVDGDEILSVTIDETGWQGVFNDDTRDYYLTLAKEAILKKLLILA